MLNKPTPYFLLVAFCLLLLFTACGEDDPSVNAGRLRVKLTDATDVSIKELYIDIREIAVFATDTTELEGEWVTLDYTGGEYNLLDLINGKKVDLVDQYFPAHKTIHSVKLVLGNNNRFISFTAKTFPLHLPSELVDEIVIDIIEPIEINPHIISSMVIDVNAALSVREINGNYFLYPSARAFPETYGSSLRGYISRDELSAILFIGINQEDDILMTLPEQDGMFLFPGLQPGPWEVYLAVHPASIYGDTAFVWNIESSGIVDITPKPLRLPLKANIPD